MRRVRGDVPELTWDQSLELMIGPNDGGAKKFERERSSFGSEEERRKAWEAHREQVVEWCLQGRPWAEEHYDAE